MIAAQPTILVVSHDGHGLYRLARLIMTRFPILMVRVCHRGDEVLKYIDHNHIVGVVTTERTTGMTGLALAQAVAQQDRDLPVILVYPTVTPEVCDAAQRAGCVAVTTIKDIAKTLQVTMFIASDSSDELIALAVNA